MMCAFTGHRPERLPWGTNESDPRCAALKIKLAGAVRRAYEDGFYVFACGMARGCDAYFADAVLELRRSVPEISLEAWLPCPSQSDGWDMQDRLRYDAQLAACSRRVITEPVYSSGCMLRRNRRMLDQAERLISVYAGGGGGTAATVRYAERKGIPIVPLWL